MHLDTAKFQMYLDQLRSVVPLVGTGAGVDAEAGALRTFQDGVTGLQDLLDETHKHPTSKEVVKRTAELRGDQKAKAKKATAKKAPAKKAATKAPAKKAAPAPAPKKGLIARLRGK